MSVYCDFFSDRSLIFWRSPFSKEDTKEPLDNSLNQSIPSPSKKSLIAKYSRTESGESKYSISQNRPQKSSFLGTANPFRLFLNLGLFLLLALFPSETVCFYRDTSGGPPAEETWCKFYDKNTSLLYNFYTEELNFMVINLEHFADDKKCPPLNVLASPSILSPFPPNRRILSLKNDKPPEKGLLVSVCKPMNLKEIENGFLADYKRVPKDHEEDLERDSDLTALLISFETKNEKGKEKPKKQFTVLAAGSNPSKKPPFWKLTTYGKEGSKQEAHKDKVIATLKTHGIINLEGFSDFSFELSLKCSGTSQDNGLMPSHDNTKSRLDLTSLQDLQHFQHLPVPNEKIHQLFRRWFDSWLNLGTDLSHRHIPWKGV